MKMHQLITKLKVLPSAQQQIHINMNYDDQYYLWEMALSIWSIFSTVHAWSSFSYGWIQQHLQQQYS